MIEKVPDYQYMVKKDTPVDIRRKLHVGDIWSNKAKCLKCGDVVRSKNRHHMNRCSCGCMSVSGGSWQLKRSFIKADDIEELSENFDNVETQDEPETTDYGGQSA